jgi:predicted TIM-barrel fold metal-dependent hydrolase
VLVDVHQHLWTRPLVQALAARTEPPFVRGSDDATVIYCDGEPPSAIDTSVARPGPGLGIDLALVALSSPVGIEALPRADALSLIEAHLNGVDAAGDGYASWGPIPLQGTDAADVDAVLDRGCVGVSLPADAVADVGSLQTLHPVLARVASRGVPLLIHPGPRNGPIAQSDPPWWPALTGYVAQMQAAWLAFVTAGRAEHPALTVVFAMLAGTAPLLGERLRLRGGPAVDLRDPRVFYDTSGYGPDAVAAVAALVGREQLVYGSDRPVVEPVPTAWDAALQARAAALLGAGGAAG